jgi:hypothetical protein
MAGVLSLFVYYAKTANPEVPYVFWFALSLVFYVRLVDAFSLRDAVLFGACGVLSICTKDQAYGLYLLSPFPVLSTLWESKRARGVQRPLAAALCDWRLTAAGVTTVALFLAIHNVPFNARGFASHVRDIVGPGSEGYRIVDRSTAGQLTLLGLTLRLDQMSWGWPFLVASIAGMVMAILVRTTRRTAVALLLMIVSYYLGFIDVILYNYDRYLLPVCIVQALFGGLALDRLLAWSAARGRAWSRAAIGGAFAYTLLYAGTIDVLMVRDSRYTAERWLVAHAGSDRLVATIFPLVDLPRLNDLRAQDLGSVELIRERAPSYFVLNADYARAVPPNTPLARLISGFQHGTLGYRRAFSYRTPNPWPWLPGAHYDLVGPRLETQVFSSLRHINPTIEIYERSSQ